MPDALVLADSPEQQLTPAEVSAHEAAVAEGATAVQAANAEVAAEEAKAAAEIALQAAQANVENAETVIEAGTKAEGAAQVATVSAEMVHEALLAQTHAIEALTEELQASRKQAVPDGSGPKRTPPPEREPANGNGKGHWYYGR